MLILIYTDGLQNSDGIVWTKDTVQAHNQMKIFLIFFSFYQQNAIH